MAEKLSDNYEILEKLGEGGMGIVYKALDKNLDRIVAIKILTPSFARDKHFIKRFQSEAKSLAKIEDTNIVTIYAFTDSSSGSFIVMQYIDGGTLANKIAKEGKLDWRAALPIIKQSLSALSHAHKAGVIHRDIKPQNILLTKEGIVKVTDFGLAKVIQDSESTVTLARAGTIYYMSPEQVKGEHDINHLSDIYSLGITFYELLAGKTPFNKSDSEFTLQLKIVEGKIPPVRKLFPDIPNELNKIIEKMINRNPAKRFQSADEVLAALDRLPTDQPEEKVQVQKSKKHTGLFVAFITLALLFSVFFILKPFSKVSTKSDNKTEIRPTRAMSEPDYQLVADSINQETNKLELNDQAAKTTKPQPEKKKPQKVLCSVSINSLPERVALYINDQLKGTTPLQLLLPQGTYEIRLEGFGYETKAERLRISTPKQDRFYVLNRLLDIDTVPSGTDVTVNDSLTLPSPFIYKTPANSKGINLLVEKAGYETIDTTIVFDKNFDNKIVLVLPKIYNQSIKLLLAQKVNIYLNGKFVGKTRRREFVKGLPPGEYLVRIETDSLYNGEPKIWQSHINVVKDKQKSFTIDFHSSYRFVIISNPNGQYLFIDGKVAKDEKNLPIQTPTQLLLSTGEHVLQVKKNLSDKNFSSVKRVNISGEYEGGKIQIGFD